MRNFSLYLYDSTGGERSIAFRCKARSVTALRQKMQEVVTGHRKGRRHNCTLDGWSIVGQPGPDKLLRILAAGGIHNGRVTDTTPAEDRLARERATWAS